MKIIDKYIRYSKEEKEKDNKYKSHVANEEEAAKIEELKERLDDFLIKTRERTLSHSWWSFDYIEDLGFVSVATTDKEVIIYSFGETVDEAFYDIMTDYELKEYEPLDPAARVHLALLDFRNYYGNNIPIEIKDFYRNYLLNVAEEEHTNEDKKAKHLQK